MEVSNTDQLIDDSKVEINNTTEETQETITTEETTVSIEELQEKISRLDEFTAKNREENAKFRKKNSELKRRYEELQSRVDSEKLKTLEDQGQFKSLYENAKAELTDMKSEKEALFMQMQAEKLSSQFKKVASKHGCQDPDLAFLTANHKFQDMIEFDSQSLKANEKSLEDVVERMKLDHPSLFSKGPLNFDSPSPTKVSSGPKSLSDMTAEEKVELLKKQMSK